MKFLIIGCGSIGRRRIKILSGLGHKICAYDQDPTLLATVCRDNDCEPFDVSMSYDFDAVFICTPPRSHETLAGMALIDESHVFCEKPLGDKIGLWPRLIKQAKEKNLVLYTGYNMRFHPRLIDFKQNIDRACKHSSVMTYRAFFGQYLPDWRPNIDYRANYTFHLGIILDASHEVDFSHWIFGEVTHVACMIGNRSNIDSIGEDTAEILLKHENGVIGSIHLDMTFRGRYRYCKAYIDRETNCEIESGYLEPDENSYKEEVEHFISCIKGEVIPISTPEDSLEVLRISLCAKESAMSGEIIEIRR